MVISTGNVLLAQKIRLLISSYGWFLLHLWPSTKTDPNVFHFTGRFKIKRMMQARILHKNTPARSCWRLMWIIDSRTWIYHGLPAVNRGKKDIVDANETVKVADHDFSKVSIFPNAVLILICPYAEYQFNNNIDLEDEDCFTVIIRPCFF